MTAHLASVNFDLPRTAASVQPRKVLHFITGIGGGGAENFLRNLVAAMEGSGWRSVIVVVRVHPFEALADQLRAQGSVIHDLNASALLNPNVWLKVRRLIAQERPDVVQTWMHHADFIGGLAAHCAGVPRVVWGVRATEVHRNPGDSALKTWVFHQALRWSSWLLPAKIIANSTAAINVHATMGYPRHKLVWVPNGVNATRFAPNEKVRMQTREMLGIPPSAPVIGFVGRFHPIKDLCSFFEALADLQTRCPAVHAILVGGTPQDLYPEAVTAHSKLPSPDQIHFVPFGSTTEQYYPAFDVFTLCSRSEAFPNVVLEAMAAGVPCVTTAAGDCPAMLDDLGEVVPCGDAIRLSLGWEKMLSMSVEERAALGARSRQRALSEYTMKTAARRFVDVYESLTKEVGA